jgi:hypothetical protein
MRCAFCGQEIVGGEAMQISGAVFAHEGCVQPRVLPPIDDNVRSQLRAIGRSATQRVR